MPDMRILIADDDPTSRLMLGRMLSKWGYDPIVRNDGMEAWEALQEEDPPALAILDWSMPGLEGPEICQRLRSAERGGSTYVILLTAKDQKDDIIAGLDSGADDYLTKPFNRDELQARLNVGRRILALQGALSHRLKEIGDALQGVQQSFLFGECPEDVAGCQIRAMTIPSSEVAGDFYDFYSYNEYHFDLVIGDVMGKGVRAAIFGAATVTRFLRSLQELTVSSHQGRRPPPPEDIVNRVRSRMSRQLSALESFVTICYARFDLQKQSLTFVDGGHLKTIHYSARSKRCGYLEGTNMPLGFLDDEQYEEQTVQFENGDIFVFYSDGITESQDASGELFGEERLARLVEEHHPEDIDSLLRHVFDGVRGFSVDEEFTDDATCVVVRIGESSADRMLCQAQFEAESGLRNLVHIHRFFADFFKNEVLAFITDDTLSEIELAVHEAIVNIMEHAYHGRDGQKIVIRTEASRDQAIFRLTHWGDTFDRKNVPPPAFDGTREGGFGVYIIEQLMTDVTYTANKDGSHCITLVKSLRE